MKKFIKRILLVLFICFAAILPVPMTFYSRDKEPKFVLEQVNEKEEEDEEEDSKEIF